MKIKIPFILIILFTVTAQAQIPTLTERNVNIRNENTENVYYNTFTKLITKKIKNLNKKESELNDSIKLKIKLMNGATFAGDVAEKAKLAGELKLDSIRITENEKKITSLNESQKLINSGVLKTKDEYKVIYDSLYNDKIKKIEKEIDEKEIKLSKIDNIEALDKEIKVIGGLKKQIISLEHELKTKDVIYNWFPSSKSKYGNVFYKRFYDSEYTETSFLNSVALNYSDLGAVIQSEVIADTFWSIRTSFGTFLQSNKKTPSDPEEKENQTESSQLEALLNGGGNFYIQNQLPVYSSMNEDITFYTFLNNRTAFGIKGLDDAIDTNTFNSSLGANLYFGLNSDKKKFNVFLLTDFSLIVASQSVYDNLQLAKKQPFFQGKLIIGITFLSQFRVAATLNSFGSDDALRSGKVTVGIQLVSK